MRVASLLSFVPNQPATRVAVFALFAALVVLTVLLVFAATGTDAPVLSPVSDLITPFRWLTSAMA
jgi:hypothetical protein